MGAEVCERMLTLRYIHAVQEAISAAQRQSGHPVVNRQSSKRQETAPQMTERPAQRTPNRQLAALIAEAGFSNAGLARRVDQLGLEHGLDLRYDKTSVTRWLRGQQPRGTTPALIAEVFTRRLGRRLTAQDLGLDACAPVYAGLEFAATSEEAVDIVSGLWRKDSGSHAELRKIAFTAAGLVVPSRDWLIGRADDRVSRADPSTPVPRVPAQGGWRDGGQGGGGGRDGSGTGAGSGAASGGTSRGVGTESGTGSGVGSAVGSGAGSGAGFGAGPGSGGGPGSGSGAGSKAGFGAAPGSGASSGAGAGPGTGPGTGPGVGPGAGSGTASGRGVGSDTDRDNRDDGDGRAADTDADTAPGGLGGPGGAADAVPRQRGRTAPAERPAAGQRPPGIRVTGGDINALRSVGELFRALDHAYGGGHARQALVRYLEHEAEPMLRGTYGEQMGRRLFGAVADLTRLAGWTSYDIGAHGLAQRYFVQALRLSQVAGDRAYGAYVLVTMSRQAVYLGHGREAVQLARVAQQGVGSSAPPAVQALLHAAEGRAYGVLGEVRACTSALVRAERALEAARPGDDVPFWARFFDEAQLNDEFGHCHRDLRQYRAAAQHAERSLQLRSPAYARSRLFCRVVLASARLGLGELDQACRLGVEAAGQAAEMRSVRAVEYVRDFERRLEPYRDAAPVRVYRDRVAALG